MCLGMFCIATFTKSVSKIYDGFMIIRHMHISAHIWQVNYTSQYFMKS